MLPVHAAQPRRRASHALAGLLMVASVVLAGCQTKTAGLGGNDLTTASTSRTEVGGSFKKTGELARQWEADRGNAKIGFAYADQLDKLGQKPNAIAVIKAVADENAEGPLALAALPRVAAWAIAAPLPGAIPTIGGDGTVITCARW